MSKSADRRPEEIFGNLIEYEGYAIPFVDAYAHFAVSVSSSWPMGLGGIYPRGHQSTYQACERVLMLWNAGDGQMLAVQRQGANCLPWLYEERGRMPVGDAVIEVTGRHVFRDSRTLASEFTFHNPTPRELVIRPRWIGWAALDEFIGEYELTEYPGLQGHPRATTLAAIPRGIECSVRPPGAEIDMPGTAIRLECISHDLVVSLSATPPWGRSRQRGDGETDRDYLIGDGLSITLPAGARQSVVFSLRFATCWHRRPAFKWPEPVESVASLDSLVASARARFLTNAGWDKPPAGGVAQIKLWRARYGLLRGGLDGDDGEFAGSIASLCTCDGSGFSTSFFWDTLFSGAAIAEWNPGYARGAIRTAFAGQSERDGSSAENKWNYPFRQRHFRQYPQAPVGTWAALRYHDVTGDTAFAREILPSLLENHRYWERYADRDGDGLAEWSWAGQTADNSPLWDATVYKQPYRISWLPPVASVSLNAFLYWDASLLMELAGRLGEKALVDRFAARRAAIWSHFEKVCYVPQEKRYWDYSHGTRRHTRVRTFYMFWPLFAGMPVPGDTARDLIENVLLDPAQFFGDVPFPSVAYDEPTYEPLGYWRGKAWPHISFWLLETLVRHGYHKEADAAANRMLSWWSLHGGLRENLATDPHIHEPNGKLDYNWGCAAFQLIATRRYREPMAFPAV